MINTHTTHSVINCFIFQFIFSMPLSACSYSYSLFVQCWFAANFAVFQANHVMVTCGHNIS